VGRNLPPSTKSPSQALGRGTGPLSRPERGILSVTVGGVPGYSITSTSKYTRPEENSVRHQLNLERSRVSSLSVRFSVDDRRVCQERSIRRSAQGHAGRARERAHARTVWARDKANAGKARGRSGGTAGRGNGGEVTVERGVKGLLGARSGRSSSLPGKDLRGSTVYTRSGGRRTWGTNTGTPVFAEQASGKTAVSYVRGTRSSFAATPGALQSTRAVIAAVSRNPQSRREWLIHGVQRHFARPTRVLRLAQYGFIGTTPVQLGSSFQRDTDPGCDTSRTRVDSRGDRSARDVSGQSERGRQRSTAGGWYDGQGEENADNARGRSAAGGLVTFSAHAPEDSRASSQPRLSRRRLDGDGLISK